MKVGGVLLFSMLLCVLAVADLPATESHVTWVAEEALDVDFDGDGRAGFGDFVLFARSFNTREGDAGFEPTMDLNADGTVDFQDFAAFAAAFGKEIDPRPTTGYLVYVADPADNSLTAFDYDTHLLADYIPFRLPSGLKLSGDEASIYVSEAFGLYVLNAAHEVIYTVPTEAEGRIELSPDGAFAYVAERRKSVLRVIDLAARAVVDTLTVGRVPVDMDITPDGKRLYVVNLDSRDVVVVDLERRQVVGRIDLGAPPGEIEITADGRRAYVTNPSRGVITVLNLETDRVVGAIQVDGESTDGLAFSPDMEILYVSSDGWLLAVDVMRNLITRSLELADETSVVGVSPDGSRAYVATFQRQGGGPGLVAVDLDSWRILGRMRGVAFPVEIQFRRVLQGEAAR